MELPNDKEAVLRLNDNDGQELELRQSKTKIYTFLGHYAMSHIFIQDGEKDEDGRALGYFLFLSQFGETEEEQVEVFTQISNLAMQSGFEMHLNIQDPSESDIEAYTEHVLGGIDDGNIS